MNLLNTKSKSNKTTVISIIVIAAVVILIAIFTIPTKLYKLSLSNNAISINSWGSTTIDLNSISTINLLYKIKK